MGNNTDSQIIKRIQSEDQFAFLELLRKYQAAIHGYAHHLTRNEHAAEEVTQEVFVAAYFGLHKLRDAANLKAWLRSITYHKSMDWLSLYHNTTPLTDSLAAAPSSSLDSLERKETHQFLAAAIRALPEPSRVVMTLKMEGLKNSQIADFLELPQNVVDNRVYRSQKKIQERMLKAFETGTPTRDANSAQILFRQIQACRPLICVVLRWLTDHTSEDMCSCISQIRSMSEETESVYQIYPDKGAAICLWVAPV